MYVCIWALNANQLPATRRETENHPGSFSGVHDPTVKRPFLKAWRQTAIPPPLCRCHCSAVMRKHQPSTLTKHQFLATALVYKSISTTGLPHAELLTELSIKRTLGITGGGCPAVCLWNSSGESTDTRWCNRDGIGPADKRRPCCSVSTLPLFWWPPSSPGPFFSVRSQV